MIGFDPEQVTQETAVKLVLGAVGGVVAGYYATRGVIAAASRGPERRSAHAMAKARDQRSQGSHEARQIAGFLGAVLTAYGIKQYLDVDKRLLFLIDANEEPPYLADWAEAAKKQAEQVATEIAQRVSP